MTTPLARTAHFAALVAAAAIGWCAHDAATPAAAAAVAVAPPPAPVVRPSPMPEAPLIAVASDGNVTLRVEQQPLEWVMEQIALQSGRAMVPSAAAAPPVPAAPPTSAPSAPSPPARTAAVPPPMAEEPQPADTLLPLVDP